MSSTVTVKSLDDMRFLNLSSYGLYIAFMTILFALVSQHHNPYSKQLRCAVTLFVINFMAAWLALQYTTTHSLAFHIVFYFTMISAPGLLLYVLVKPAKTPNSSHKATANGVQNNLPVTATDPNTPVIEAHPDGNVGNNLTVTESDSPNQLVSEVEDGQASSSVVQPNTQGEHTTHNRNPSAGTCSHENSLLSISVDSNLITNNINTNAHIDGDNIFHGQYLF